MKIAILGATGTTGQHFVQQALENGHTVTVLVRSPLKLTIQNPRLNIIVGDVLNAEDVACAVAGQNAIFIALGTGKIPKKSRIRADGTQHVVNAIEASGERPHVVVLSSLGVGDSQQQMPFYWRWILNLVLRYTFADHNQQESIIGTSALDWTILRPTFMKDKPKNNSIKATPTPDVVNVQASLSFADVAGFALNTIEKQEKKGLALTLTS